MLTWRNSTRCVFMWDFTFHLMCLLPWTLSHRATEQRHYCTKGKRFYSQFVPFIHYRGNARKLMEKRWFNKCRKERRERNRRLECFLSTLSLLSFNHFWKHFSRKNVVVTLRRQLYSSNPQILPSDLIYPRGHLQLGMKSSCFLCPSTLVNLSSS